MALGDIIRFAGEHYDIRGVVDDRFVVRFRNERTGKETYRIWTADERATFDAENLKRADRNDHNGQIYERLLSGETQAGTGGRIRTLGRTDRADFRQPDPQGKSVPVRPRTLAVARAANHYSTDNLLRAMRTFSRSSGTAGSALKALLASATTTRRASRRARNRSTLDMGAMARPCT